MTLPGNDEEKVSPPRYSRKELTRQMNHHKIEQDHAAASFTRVPPVILVQTCSSMDEVESDISVDHHTFSSKSNKNGDGNSTTQSTSWHCFGPSSFVQKAVNRNMNIIPTTTTATYGGVVISGESHGFVDWPSDEETPVPPPSSISKHRNMSSNLKFSTIAAEKAMEFFSGDHAFDCGNFNTTTTTASAADRTGDKNKVQCKKWPLSHHDFLTINPCVVMGRDDKEEVGDRVTDGTEKRANVSSHEPRDPFPLSTRHRQNL